MEGNSSDASPARGRTTDSLKGKIAIVTGAARGLGKAIATALVRAGAAVVVNDIDKEGGEATARGLVDGGGEALFHHGDVSNVEDVARLIRMTVDRYTRIDILVNNAGLQYVAPLAEFPVEKWNYLIGVMLSGSFFATKYAFPHMQARRYGRIINISSANGLVASEFKCAYVSAKHGLIGLTKATALEGAPHNITAVAVCPSFVRTELVEKQIPEQAKYRGISEQEVVEKIVLGPVALKRVLEPEEVAALVAFLCTDAAQGITGSAIPIDCGWTAH
jgi:3-hydroxybutyrate dehydrogenase